MSEKLIIDLTNYKDRQGAKVTPGNYTVVVDDVESTKSNAGNPMVNIWLRIVGTEFDGQTIVDRLTITEKALFRVVSFMNAIGIPTPKKKFQIDVKRFLGKTLEVSVDDGEPYNNVVRSEVRAYYRSAKKVTSEEVADLDDLQAAADEAEEVPEGNAPAEGAEPDALPVDDLDELDLDELGDI